MNIQIFILTGLFFQRHQTARLGQHEGGATLFAQKILFPYMFYGVMQTDHKNVMGELIGVMKDDFGESVISDITLLEDDFEFTKTYTSNNKLVFKYKFQRRQDGVWICNYSRRGNVEGSANCIITEVREEFFRPQHYSFS